VDRVAREHLHEVERKVADLEALRHELRGLLGRCRHGTAAECRIEQALSPDRSAFEGRNPAQSTSWLRGNLS
jgi:hypothetical protein